MPRYEIAIANAAANNTWGNESPMGHTGHGLLHRLRRVTSRVLVPTLPP